MAKEPLSRTEWTGIVIAVTLAGSIFQGVPSWISTIESHKWFWAAESIKSGAIPDSLGAGMSATEVGAFMSAGLSAASILLMGWLWKKRASRIGEIVRLRSELTEAQRVSADNMKEACRHITRIQELEKLVPSGGGKLQIHSAFYGTGGHNDIDLTSQVQKLATDSIAIDVSNNLIVGKPDPSPNQRKRLEVVYSFGVLKNQKCVRAEHALMVLPEDWDFIRETAAEYERKRLDDISKVRAAFTSAGTPVPSAPEKFKIEISHCYT